MGLAVLAGGYERFASKEEEIVAQKIMDPRELFLHDLGAMLKAERDIAKALPRMQKAASDAELQSRLERHVGETRRHVWNLEQAFKRLGARPKPGRAVGAEALGQEFQESSASVGREPAYVVVTGVAARVEPYQIGAYESLIAMARALGERNVAKLLGDNLAEEKEMLRSGEKVARRLAKEAATSS